MNKESFWKFALRGGKSGKQALLVHGMCAVLLIGAWVLKSAHLVAYLLIGAVQAVYWYGTWRNYKGRQA